MADEPSMLGPQPAMPPEWIGAQARRPRPGFGIRTARRGWALVRAIVLAVLAGVLMALIIAAIFGLIVMAVDSNFS